MPARGNTKDRSCLVGKSMESFRQAIKSPVTLDAYERRLAEFFRNLEMDVDTFVEKSRADKAWAQNIILNHMLRQKTRAAKGEISAATLPNMRKPIRLLLEMNDVIGINWTKISRLMPKARRYALDRAPTIEEIRMMLSDSDIRFQAIILIMLSGGIRVGSWDDLKWGHVQPIFRENNLVAASLKIYPGDVEEYFTFITPEAYRKLEEYVKMRSRFGEKIDGSSPVIRDKWDAAPRGSFQPDVLRPKRLTSAGVKRLIEITFWKLGLRTEKKRRHEFSIHSFRKYFKTRAEQVMKPINVETLMGHSTGISDSYYRPTEKDLLDDYLRAVPLLTISEVDEVRRESQVSREQLEGRLKQLEDLVSRLAAEKGRQVLYRDQSRSEDTSNGDTKKRVVVKNVDVERMLNEGWEPRFNLEDGRVVMMKENIY